MHPPAFAHELAALLGVAVVVVVASSVLRLPSVVGLLITGFVVGPSGFGLVSSTETVEQVAELGVVALLFTLGLEFSRGRIRAVQRSFVIGGSVQLFATIALVAGGALAIGRPANEAVFFGCLIALSSTAIVLKLYGERRDLDAPHGQLVVGVLLFQDVMLAPMIAIVPLLGPDGGGDATAGLGGRLAIGAAVVGGGFVVARTVLPRVLSLIAATRLREILLLGSIAVCLGLSLLTAELGFSPALGAFLAGVVLAESDLAHQIAAEIGSFRDVLTSLFFVSIGMLLDLGIAAAHLPEVLGLTLAIVVVKTLASMLATPALRIPIRPVLIAALGLAQVGEFSFVLSNVGHVAGILSDTTYQVFIAASVGTMLLTPLLISIAPYVAEQAERLTRVPLGDVPPSVARSGHVIVVGFGVNGRNLARVLREASIGYVILEMNPTTVAEAKLAGEPILFGDGGRAEILEHVGVEHARAIVFAAPDPDSVRRGVRLARERNPHLYVVVRTRHFGDIEELRRIGADDIIAEEFETSIEIVARVLQRYHVPRNVADAQIHLLRADSYEMLRQPGRAGSFSSALIEILEAGTTEVYHLSQGSLGVGQTLGQLDLRRATGASVISIVRNQRPIANPGASLELEAGDSLVLVGAHAELEAAFELLDG